MATATEPTIEQRLAALEAAVAAIRQQSPPRAAGVLGWLQQTSGSMKDKSAFREMIAHGLAYRHEDRPRDGESS